MAYKDLREFIDILEGKGLLTRVGAEVDPEWEINGVTCVATSNNGPAVLFEKVKGTTTTVLSELFGRSWRRVALAMNMDTEDPVTIRNEWMKRLEGPIAPKVVKTGPCKEHLLMGDKANLDGLFPKVRWHEQDGNYYFGTLGMQVTADSETGEQNVGCYRMMYQDGVTAKLMMQPFQGGAQHLRQWGRRYPGKPMPMAVVFGADPCYVLAGGSKFVQPPSEEAYAGALRQEALELVKCELSDLLVPASAEIVVEGEVMPDEWDHDGPFGEFTGFLSQEKSTCNVFRVTAITHRSNPIFHGEREGYPSEGGLIYVLGMEPIVYKKLQALEGVLDVHIPLSGVGFELIVSMRVSRKGQVRQLIQTVFGDQEVGGYIKHVVVVDEGIDIRDRDDVAWAIATHVQADRDLLIIPRCPQTSLDVSQTNLHWGTKLGIDATMPRFVYEAEGKTAPVRCNDPEIQKRVKAQWHKYGITLPG
ncbi:MAG: UbiD family decarboxylase [Solidesulfovibrio magneticus str. Maddingley MBC34]|uniref:UbiD family decarboxylase n=1 Tax=Solidesulfovibrio magneticus str. Maddingley MBC34 TaxID=1206767 RepID=K6HFG3_9BACT|nr:MAG: UbiD family decarboxylase [Solidesulfovibrio magneticus str. Maddingley MBC34]